MMTKQQTFDAVVEHLKTASHRSVNPNSGTCAYRGEDNAKCAIGALIPDDMYDQQWDISVLGSDDVWPHISVLFTYEGEHDDEILWKSLLCDLQSCHDNQDAWHYGYKDWDALLDVADTHRLDGSKAREMFLASPLDTSAQPE